MSKPTKKKAGKPVNTTASPRKGYQLPSRVDDHMRDTLERVAKKDRRKVAQMVVILLEEALRARGEWTDPPEPAAEGH